MKQTKIIYLSFLQVICLIMIGIKLDMPWYYYALAGVSLLYVKYTKNTGKKCLLWC